MIALLALALSANPALLRLGTDARAVVHVPGEERPSLSASVGRCENLRRNGDGWDVDYLPPDDVLPKVGIVLAVRAHEAGFVAVPLWGAGEALVKTRPRAQVTVQIGAQTFGPQRADEHGEAVVPVVVPPGVNEARAGRKVIDLHVPPTRVLHLAASRDEALADRAGHLTLHVVSVTAQGTAAGTAPEVTVDRGALSTARIAAPGLYELDWTLPAGPAGAAHARAGSGALAAEVTVQLAPGPAARLEVVTENPRLSASAPHAAIRVRAFDAAGNPSSFTPRFATSFGELRAQPDGAGTWRLALEVPASFGGRDFVEVRAESGSAAASTRLALVPAEPATVRFDRNEYAVRADGRTVQLALVVADRYGNAVRAAAAEARASAGSAQARATPAGWNAQYVPPVLHDFTAGTLVVRAGEAEGSARLRLVPALRPAAVSPRFGYITNLSGFTSPLAGLEGAIRSELMGPQLSISLAADYGYSTRSASVASGLEATSRTDLLLVRPLLSFRRPLGERATGWISAGPQLAAFWSHVTAAGIAQHGYAVTPGAALAAGYERRFGAAVPFVELNASWNTSPNLPILRGPLRALSLAAGVRLELF